MFCLIRTFFILSPFYFPGNSVQGCPELWQLTVANAKWPHQARRFWCPARARVSLQSLIQSTLSPMPNVFRFVHSLGTDPGEAIWSASSQSLLIALHLSMNSTAADTESLVHLHRVVRRSWLTSLKSLHPAHTHTRRFWGTPQVLDAPQLTILQHSFGEPLRRHDGPRWVASENPWSLTKFAFVCIVLIEISGSFDRKKWCVEKKWHTAMNDEKRSQFNMFDVNESLSVRTDRDTGSNVTGWIDLQSKSRSNQTLQWKMESQRNSIESNRLIRRWNNNVTRSRVLATVSFS
jgi:hypothetical protein